MPGEEGRIRLVARTYLHEVRDRPSHQKSDKHLLAEVALRMKAMQHLSRIIEHLRTEHGLFPESHAKEAEAGKEAEAKARLRTAVGDYLASIRQREPEDQRARTAIRGDHNLARAIAWGHRLEATHLMEELYRIHGIVFIEEIAQKTKGGKTPRPRTPTLPKPKETPAKAKAEHPPAAPPTPQPKTETTIPPRTTTPPAAKPARSGGVLDAVREYFGRTHGSVDERILAEVAGGYGITENELKKALRNLRGIVFPKK